MQELVSPKQVARAIGVSESSMKRWCDRGVIPSIRTAGGHRKLPINAVLTFLKSSGHTLVEPEVLGLPSTTGQGQRTLVKSKARLRGALLAGNEAVCRQVVLDLFLSDVRLSVIFDGVIADAFEEIGQLWDCGDAEVYQERRACEICLRVLHELRHVLPQVSEAAPVATGGTLSEDNYVLATNMAELVLRENGWKATSLGNSLPTATLEAAIRETQPRLFWLSVSHIPDQERFLQEAARIYEAARQAGAALAVGGRALTEELRKRIQYSAYCDTMQHLESFAQTLFP